MNNGWLKLHRKIIDKAFYSKDSEKVHLWIHLLLRANHSEYEEMLGGKPIICNSGQFTTGRKQLSNETGISESKIERILTYLEKIEQQIEQQKTTTNRLISIVNWSEYQNTEQRNEQQVNNERTTSEQQVNTHQEDKEIKEVKKKYIYDEFYDNQIVLSKDDQNYIQFVKILFGENNLKIPLKGVLKIKNQLTYNQFSLVYTAKIKYNVSLTTILENIENRPDLLKKYSLLQRVILNWIKPKDFKR
jgi:hypothetical protein